MDFSGVEDLTTSNESSSGGPPLFQDISNRDRTDMRSDQRIFRPNVNNPRKRPRAEELGVSAEKLQAIAGDREQRERQFQATLESLKDGLENSIQYAVYTHPLYEFVGAVHGEIGVRTTGDPTLGFDTHQAMDEIESVMVRMRRIHALQERDKGEYNRREMAEIKYREAQRRITALREKEERLMNNLTPSAIHALLIWEQAAGTLDRVIEWNNAMAMLFQREGPGADPTYEKILGGVPLADFDRKILSQIREILRIPGNGALPPEKLLTKIMNKELYPLDVGTWGIDILYGASPMGGNVRKRPFNRDLVDYIYAESEKPEARTKPVKGVKIRGQEERDGGFDAATASPTSLINALEDPQTNPTSEGSDGSSSGKASSRGDEEEGKGKKANVGVNPKVERVNTLHQVYLRESKDNGDSFAGTFLSEHSKRVFYAFVLWPALQSLSLIADAFGISQEFAFGRGGDAFESAQYRIAEAIRVLSGASRKNPTPKQVVGKMKSVAKLLLPDAQTNSVFAIDAGDRPQLLILKVIRHIMIGDRLVESIAAENEMLAEFQLYVEMRQEEVKRLMDLWEARVRDLDVWSPSRYHHDDIAACIVAALMMKQWIHGELVRLEAERQREMKAARQADGLRNERIENYIQTHSMAMQQSEANAERAKIDKSVTSVASGDLIGPSNDIVQAMNAAFLLVKQSLPAYRQLQYSENIALTNNDDVRTAFAKLTGLKLRQSQLGGPVSGYNQNVHYSRTKIGMREAIDYLREYQPRIHRTPTRDMGVSFERRSPPPNFFF